MVLTFSNFYPFLLRIGLNIKKCKYKYNEQIIDDLRHSNKVGCNIDRLIFSDDI
jgi:hypothetical protein